VTVRAVLCFLRRRFIDSWLVHMVLVDNRNKEENKKKVEEKGGVVTDY